MSKGNTAENKSLALVLNGVDWAGIADNASSSPLVNLYLALHTADPGEGGDQSTSEVAYTSYARVAVNRTGTGWTITGNEAVLAADKTFPAGTGGSGTATHFSVGTAASGAGSLIYSGTLTNPIVCGSGVTPILDAATTKITED